jgi:AraC-like DNA-binding protein
MRKAKKLLEFTFLNVKEVMNRVGAYDASHFVRDFKRTYGVTPAQYRARYLTLIAAKKEDREVISSDRPINRQFGQ